MMTCIADIASAGGYFSWHKIIVMLVLVVPWLLVSPWVHRDAKHILSPQVAWSSAVVGAGAIGLFLWLVLPLYVLGLMIYVVLVGAVIGAYAVCHNSRCDESEKVLTASFFTRLASKADPKSAKAVIPRIKLYNSNGRITLPPGEDATKEDVQSYDHTQDILYDLIYRRASESDLSPAGGNSVLRMVIDGVLAAPGHLPAGVGESVIQYIKKPAGMDVEERRRPQQGKISVDIGGGKPLNVILTTAGTTGGQRMQFRMVQEVVRTDITRIGLSENVRERLEAIIALDKGIFIVSGRPRNGVTSTLYSLLSAQDAFIKQLVTLEKKEVVDLENITQYAYGQPEELSHMLASAIRRDPDVIMVDQCPDTATAELIIQASKTKLILLGMNARDSFMAMAKWVKICPNATAAMQNLTGVLCQTLLRLLCPECREAYHPDPQMLAKANIPAEGISNFYRKPTKPRVDEKGRAIICETCQESGYFGRTGAFELLEVTDKVRQMVIAGDDLRQIRAACRKNKMLNLQEHALKKVIQGLTSIKEVIRVTQKNRK